MVTLVDRCSATVRYFHLWAKMQNIERILRAPALQRCCSSPWACGRIHVPLRWPRTGGDRGSSCGAHLGSLILSEMGVETVGTGFLSLHQTTLISPRIARLVKQSEGCGPQTNPSSRPSRSSVRFRVGFDLHRGVVGYELLNNARSADTSIHGVGTATNGLHGCHITERETPVQQSETGRRTAL